MKTSLLSKKIRVEIPPASDWWMRGARFGTVVNIKNMMATVLMDNPQIKRPLKFMLDELKEV